MKATIKIELRKDYATKEGGKSSVRCPLKPSDSIP